MSLQTPSANHNLEPIVFWERFGADICKSISSTVNTRDSKIFALKSSFESLSLRLDADGKTFFVKHRNVASKAGRKPHKVECDALRILGASKLAPRLVSYSDENQILVQEFISGAKVRSVCDSRSLRDFCKNAGKWLKVYSNKAPFFKNHGSWYEYLTNYPDLLSSSSISATREFLETMKFDRHVLSRNSGALSDLVLCQNGSMRSANFDRCQFKPFGWDLLLTARAFSQAYPDKVELITTQLARGFCGGSKDSAARWESLLRVFTIGMVFETGTETAPSPAELALAKFNKDNTKPAEIVATSPHLENHFVPQDKVVLKTFRAHLRSLAKDVLALEDVHEPEPALAVENPHAGFSALCGGCQGDCCRMGVGHNAFIEEHVVGRLLKQQADSRPKDLVERYEAYIPEEHVSGSCFYHGPKGCSLPREMRSDICNRYACGAARNLLRKIEETGAKDVLCIAGYGRKFKKGMQAWEGQVSEVPKDQFCPSEKSQCCGGASTPNNDLA